MTLHTGHRTRTNTPLPVQVDPHNNRGTAWLELGLSPTERDQLAVHIAGRLAAQAVIGRPSRPAVETIRRALDDHRVRLTLHEADRLRDVLDEQAAVAWDWPHDTEGDVIATARIEDRA